ncbi:hypothetical protein ABT369_18965 [Dactylosporangium sp. NPDC000244]|uniref:hypothetical protein n=1 Tax=Dactylosporangium sp. NPDC000244 TaxID=3154365 RepID=UPI00332E075C
MIVVFDGVQSLDVTGPLEVFTGRRQGERQAARQQGERQAARRQGERQAARCCTAG